jgi:hypothetical protein
MQRLLTIAVVVCAMLAVEFALRSHVSFIWRVVAMGVVSAVLLGAAKRWGQRRG